METFNAEIEKGIPVPGKFSKSKYDVIFDQMEIGDSFVVESEVERQRIVSYWNVGRRKKLGERYCSRKTADSQYRIWRIEQ